MADNIIAGKPDMYVSRVTGTPESKGFDADNTAIIYDRGPTNYRSWKPGFPINSLTTLTEGQGILIDPLTTREDETNLIGGGFIPDPGVTGYTGLVTVGSDVDFASGGETSIIMRDDGTTYDIWIRFVGSTGVFWRHATNDKVNNWSDNGPVDVGGVFPTVFKHGVTFYMFLNPSDYTTTKNVFLYSSANRFTWTILNGGVTVMPVTADATSWYRTLFNTGACVIGDNVHVLVEGRADSGAYSLKPWLGYAVAPIGSPVFTFTALPQIEGGGNACLVHVPDHNAIVVLYGAVTSFVADDWHLRAAIGSLATDLTQPENWTISATDLSMFEGVADPFFVLTPGKRYPSMILYNRDQTDNHTTYLPFITSVNDLYDALI